MSSRFEHQALSDPIMMFQEIHPSFAHRLTLQSWPRSFDHPNRITAGMSVDAFENGSHDEVKVSKQTGLRYKKANMPDIAELHIGSVLCN
jgi:hypothetical protein